MRTRNARRLATEEKKAWAHLDQVRLASGIDALLIVALEHVELAKEQLFERRWRDVRGGCHGETE